MIDIFSGACAVVALISGALLITAWCLQCWCDIDDDIWDE